MLRLATCSSRTVRARAVLAAVLVTCGLAACNGDDDDGAADPDAGDGNGDCLPKLSLDCDPSFEPATFDSIFQNVLRPSCGSASTGSLCHSQEGRMAGLVLQERDEAYDSLLGELDGRPRVVAGEPECSVLVQRVESKERRFRMPLNSDPLDPGLVCAIRLWIADGAEP